MIWSGIVLIASLLLFARLPWAPVVGVILASISCLFWLFALPVLPPFAFTAITLDALAIYGLVAHGAEI